MINSCYKCEERHLGCHSRCERYISAKAAHDAQREKAREIDRQRGLQERIEIERRLEIARRRHGKKGRA